jgi:hypothetical protein
VKLLDVPHQHPSHSSPVAVARLPQLCPLRPAPPRPSSRVPASHEPASALHVTPRTCPASLSPSFPVTHEGATIETSPLRGALATPTCQQRDSGKHSIRAIQAANKDGHAVDVAIQVLPAVQRRLYPVNPLPLRCSRVHQMSLAETRHKESPQISNQRHHSQPRR